MRLFVLLLAIAGTIAAAGFAVAQPKDAASAAPRLALLIGNAETLSTYPTHMRAKIAPIRVSASPMAIPGETAIPWSICIEACRDRRPSRATRTARQASLATSQECDSTSPTA